MCEGAIASYIFSSVISAVVVLHSFNYNRVSDIVNVRLVRVALDAAPTSLLSCDSSLKVQRLSLLSLLL